MTTPVPARTALDAISPFFIVGDLESALTYYRERLGFEVTFRSPDPDPFFAIVVRDGVQLMLKEIGENVPALPNARRHPYARWDAFIHVSDPDALAAELRARGAAFHTPPADTHDGLRGFELTDHDGYVLFFGRPQP